MKLWIPAHFLALILPTSFKMATYILRRMHYQKLHKFSVLLNRYGIYVMTMQFLLLICFCMHSLEIAWSYSFLLFIDTEIILEEIRVKSYNTWNNYCYTDDVYADFLVDFSFLNFEKKNCTTLCTCVMHSLFHPVW